MAPGPISILFSGFFAAATEPNEDPMSLWVQLPIKYARGGISCTHAQWDIFLSWSHNFFIYSKTAERTYP